MQRRVEFTLFAGPNWKGDIPPGIKTVFRSETDIVLALARTALNGPDDVAAVKAVQAGMTLEPLSSFLKTAAPAPAPPIEFPPYDVARGRSHDFIVYLNFLLRFTQPPGQADQLLGETKPRCGSGRWERSACPSGNASYRHELLLLFRPAYPMGGWAGVEICRLTSLLAALRGASASVEQISALRKGNVRVGGGA